MSSKDQTNLRVMWRKVWLGRFSLDIICNISQTRGEAAGYKNTFSSILQHWRAALVALKKCLVLGALRLTAYTARLCNFSWMRKSEFWRLFAFSRVFSINQGKTKVNWKLFSFQKIYSPKRMNERREDRALPLLTLMITLITLIITLCITDTTSHNFHGIVLPPGHWWLSISLVSPICDHPVGCSVITQPESRPGITDHHELVWRKWQWTNHDQDSMTAWIPSSLTWRQTTTGGLRLTARIHGGYIPRSLVIQLT